MCIEKKMMEGPTLKLGSIKHLKMGDVWSHRALFLVVNFWESISFMPQLRDL